MASSDATFWQIEARYRIRNNRAADPTRSRRQLSLMMFQKPSNNWVFRSDNTKLMKRPPWNVLTHLKQLEYFSVSDSLRVKWPQKYFTVLEWQENTERRMCCPPPVGGFDLTMIMAKKAKPMRTLSTWMSSMERGRFFSTVVLKPGITPVMLAPGREEGDGTDDWQSEGKSW